MVIVQYDVPYLRDQFSDEQSFVELVDTLLADPSARCHVQDLAKQVQALAQLQQTPPADRTTVQDLKEALVDPSRIWNCLKAPDLPFEDDLSQMAVSPDAVLHNLAAKVYLREVRPDIDRLLSSLDDAFADYDGFYLFGAAGSFTPNHMDGGGALTQVDFLKGGKVWTCRPSGIDGPASHIVVMAGSRLLMVPGVVHSVYTYEHSVCRGRHFLRYDYMSATYRACRETAEHKDDTNEVLPITLFYVALMSIALAYEEFVRRMQLGSPLTIVSYASVLLLILQKRSKLFPNAFSPSMSKVWTKLAPEAVAVLEGIVLGEAP